jgi:hypothetical protein
VTTLTKTDIAALRKCDSIAVHLSQHSPEGKVRAIKRAKKSERDPFAQDVEHVVTANVKINGGWCDDMQDKIKKGHAACFALVNLYHEQRTPESNVIHTLREGDEITFRFYPDAHSNGYVAQANLHADVLYLDVTRKGKRFTWELDSGVCPDNSARMCHGLTSDSYRRTQEAMAQRNI